VTSNFAIAERYIQLRKVCAPESWGDLVIRINEMILTPLITIFFVFLHGSDAMTVIPAVFTVYRTWTEFLEYCELRFAVQRMYLKTMQIGGPFIVTNDPEYIPYVFADAVTRDGMRRQGSGRDHLRAGP
jgi:hypothetical protein